MRAVITTYEGKHNHDVPAARGSGYSTNRLAQDPSSAPIRPNAIAGHTSYTTSSQAPYTLQMLHNNNTSTGHLVVITTTLLVVGSLEQKKNQTMSPPRSLIRFCLEESFFILYISARKRV